MHIPNLVWIVVEDSSHRTDLVTNLLGHCSIASVHLTAVTPAYYKRDKWKPRGVLQRNAGLSWIREHFSHRNCNGVVYFGDDDNSYDLRVFDAVMSAACFHVVSVLFACTCMYIMGYNFVADYVIVYVDKHTMPTVYIHILW